jgi:hypothetical protein
MVLLMLRRSWLYLLIPLCAAGLASCVEHAWEVRTYPLGQKVTLGHLTYVAIETQWYPALGEGPGARAAQNQFLLVRVSVTNGGSAEAASPNLTVEDSAGRRYPELSDGEGVTDWIGALRLLAPADSLTGNAVFDVPPGHYTLHILDEDNQHEARIDLPLNFQTAPTETPGLDLLKPEQAAPAAK